MMRIMNGTTGSAHLDGDDAMFYVLRVSAALLLPIL